MSKAVGEKVTVRGSEYVVTGRRDLSYLGGKAYGKHAYTLRRVSDGTVWETIGKTVAASSGLRPVNESED